MWSNGFPIHRYEFPPQTEKSLKTQGFQGFSMMVEISGIEPLTS
jgi:hypothetical protein